MGYPGYPYMGAMACGVGAEGAGAGGMRGVGGAVDAAEATLWGVVAPCEAEEASVVSTVATATINGLRGGPAWQFLAICPLPPQQRQRLLTLRRSFSSANTLYLVAVLRSMGPLYVPDAVVPVPVPGLIPGPVPGPVPIPWDRVLPGLPVRGLVRRGFRKVASNARCRLLMVMHT